MRDFKDISYLQEGNEKQRRAFEVMTKLGILNVLKEYDPILVGTIPISIDTDKSDLDIICHVKNFEEFTILVKDHFGTCKDFLITSDKTAPTVINFIYDNFDFELYASSEPTSMQNGYRHMLIEDRLLTLLGQEFKEQVINLKKSGLKTEPAFAKLLDLEGNPYQALLDLEELSDEQLKNLFKFFLRLLCR